MKKLLSIFVLFFVVCGLAQAQDYLNLVPNWKKSSEDQFPSYPPKGDIYTWYYTNKGTNWNTDYYIPFVYDQMPFRLMPPQGVDFDGNENSNNYNFEFDDPNKKYPLVIMLHGIGEKGIENNHQLKHGGRQHRDAVRNGDYPGYVMFPQNWGNYFGEDKQRRIVEIIDMLVQEGHVDINRITVHGLSAGGSGVWNIIPNYAKYFAAIVPMSAANPTTVRDHVNIYKYIPIWLSQGGLDNNPQPSSAFAIQDIIDDAGGNMKLSLYENLGHGTWNRMYAEDDFFPFLLRANKTNINVLYGGNRRPDDPVEICPGDPINVRLGITAGFNGYEWRRNGNLIGGANGNEYVASEFGDYQVRFRRGTTWTDWSAPLVIRQKDLSDTPPITTVGLASNVLPALDGKTTIELGVEEEYFEYEWAKVGSSQIVSTSPTITVSEAGEYVVAVKDISGCFTNFSQPFQVIVGNGPNSPDPASNLSAQALSETQIELNWDQNPSPVNNETNFEIYRATSQSGPYTLVKITNADASSFVDANLTANTTYHYKMRAINTDGASSPSNVAEANTLADTQAPTAPPNLTVTSTSPSTISLAWSSSTDNVGIYNYEIYQNGQKILATTDTEITVFGLTTQTVYTFTVKARDEAGNRSPASNQVTAAPVLNGLTYYYYHGSWDQLPDFNTLTPEKIGNSDNVDIGVRTQNDNFAFLWEGYINIPVSGSYTFETRSDDGSKLYINPQPSGVAYDESYLVVNNDGLHGSRYRQGTINLTQGVHPIAITFFEKGGGERMEIYWKNTAHGVGSRQRIPDSAFKEDFTMPAPPAQPTALTATAISHNQIDLSWADNSNNESGFEIYRSVNPAGPFNIVATVEGNSYSDADLEAETKYYYRVQSVGPTGQSGFSIQTGLDYSYYHGAWSSLPNFNNLTPVATGTADNFDISLRTRNNDFAFKFEGVIQIPTDGQYTFFTKSDDGSKLFINGNQIVNNDGLHGCDEESGTVSLTAGVHDITVTFFERGGGECLEVRWQGPGINKQLIPTSALSEEDANATTNALPPPPSVPNNFSATSISTTSIELSWNDASDNESGFEIYRSTTTNDNYKLIATLEPAPGNSSLVTYTNTNLFPNVSYYYKVRSIGEGGNSVFTSEVNISTQNSLPVLADIEDEYTMHYSENLNIPLSATDEDGDDIDFSSSNLPSFATIIDNGDGTGALEFNPSAANQGTYEGIIIAADDEFGGSDTETFRLIVNDNYHPELAAISNQSIDENSTLEITLSATDQNVSDPIEFGIVDLPDFATLTDHGDGSASLSFAPGFSDAYVYNLTATVSDGRGGMDSKTFVVTVNDVEPPSSKVYFNFSKNVSQAAPWNNSQKNPRVNDSFSNLADDSGANSGISITFLTDWGGAANQGAVTGNNSGVVPDNVLKEYYWFGRWGAPETVQIRVAGLSTTESYNFKFVGSSMWSGDGITDNGETNYTINGQTAALDVQGNTNNYAQISGVNASSGEVIIDISKGNGAEIGYINGLIIESVFDDGSVPAKPKGLMAEITPESEVRLSWDDVAFNETGYEIHRATDAIGPFTLLNANPQNANSETFTDNTVLGSTSYYYKMKAVNQHGESDFTETVSISLPNAAPVITTIDDIEVESETSYNINVSANDGEGGSILLQANNLPGFASFTDLGNGQGTLSLTPQTSDVGIYQDIEIEATDGQGESSTETFTIIVNDHRILSKVYFNFSRNHSAPSPWNNSQKVPNINDSFSNLQDDSGANSGISITFLTDWGGTAPEGAVTGNNSGIVPDNVLREYYWFGRWGAPETVQIRVAGLSTTESYNFKFVGSSVWSGDGITDNGETNYTINGQTAALDVQGNTNSYAQISGINASSGEVIIEISKGNGAEIGYINGLIIESVEVGDFVFEPSNLSAEGISESQINLSWIDNSPNETGFEIYRSSSQSGPFNLIHTTGINATSYQDQNLAKNTQYFYQIRAIGDTQNSQFTNVVNATTVDFSVLVNFNNGHNVGLPWNSFNRVPGTGENMQNLQDVNSQSTGMHITLESDWTGDFDDGPVTGDDSGIYPDDVLQTFYYVFPGELGLIKISGLKLNYVYDFKFLGNWRAEAVSEFTIGTQSVTQSVLNNTSSTVSIKNQRVNDFGEIEIVVSAPEGSGAAVLNALEIVGRQDYINNPSARVKEDIKVIKSTLNEQVENDLVAQGGSVHSVYPIPFTNSINIQLEQAVDDIFDISLVDLSGRVVYSEKADALIVDNKITLDLSANNIVSGVYILKVHSNVSGSQIFRVVKQ